MGRPARCARIEGTAPPTGPEPPTPEAGATARNVQSRTGACAKSLCQFGCNRCHCAGARRIFNHRWDDPATFLQIGTIPARDIANLTGFPDLIVPAGFTGDNLPVGLSFLGSAFSEPRLLGLGYSFEQATHARRRPVHTPARSGESISVP